MGQARILAGIALSAGIVSAQGVAGGYSRLDDGYYVNARVVRIEPIVRVVEVATPHQVCWNERVRHLDEGYRPRRNTAVPVIAGGVLGGVAGNRLGKRRHRSALTVAGTVLGALLGHSISREPRYLRREYRLSWTYFTTERRCETRTEYHDEERIEGYEVTYRYHGREFTTRTDYEPGRHIRVHVQVEPTSDYEPVTSDGRWSRRDHRLDPVCGTDCADTWL